MIVPNKGLSKRGVFVGKRLIKNLGENKDLGCYERICAGVSTHRFGTADCDWVGAWRQMPKVDGEFNKDFQREEYVTTARYGVKIYRPENLVTILSDPTAVG